MSTYITTLSHLLNTNAKSLEKLSKEDIILAFYEDSDSISPAYYIALSNCPAKIELTRAKNTIGSCDNLLFAAGLIIGASKNADKFYILMPNADSNLKSLSIMSLIGKNISLNVSDGFDFKTPVKNNITKSVETKTTQKKDKTSHKEEESATYNKEKEVSKKNKEDITVAQEEKKEIVDNKSASKTEDAESGLKVDASDEIVIPNGLFDDDEENVNTYKEFCACIPKEAIPVGLTLNQFAPILLKTLQHTIVITEATHELEGTIGKSAENSMSIIDKKGFFLKLKNYAIELEY